MSGHIAGEWFFFFFLLGFKRFQTLRVGRVWNLLEEKCGFQSGLKKKTTTSLEEELGEGRSLFPLLSANSLQVAHFSTDAVKARFNRDNGEKARSLSDGDCLIWIFHQSAKLADGFLSWFKTWSLERFNMTHVSTRAKHLAHYSRRITI